MCNSCFMRAFRDFNSGNDDIFSHVGAAGTFDKLTTAFPIDGVGDLKPPVTPAVLITTDTVPDAPDTAGNTNPVLTVTPAGTTTPTISTIDTLGDQDFYKVTLTAGATYEFGLYSHTGGPNLVGLTDPYLELYAADGTTLVVSADGGADTVYNQINSGFDVLLVYTPTASGTYYVNARAFSNTPLTSTGDSVGDYELFAREQDPSDPNIYRPYYEPSEPLYAIDWGTQVDKVNTTVRNPDGDEGTRATGNEQGTPVYGSGLDIAGLAAAQGVDVTGKNVITIYFARPGDVFVSNDPTNPGLPPATITAVAIQDFERTAVWTSLAEFAEVADVVYLEVDNRDDADFIYTSYTGTPGPGISLLGSMSPPGESDEGLAQFNSGDYRWNATDLQQGGFSFVTLIHEFGHGHGLAHPHDNGGRSGIMNGVEQEDPTSVADYTTGDFELNQGVFTMMSYEDGWQSSPYGNAPTDVGYGYLGGLMAFDIAAIQDKYGVNEEWATGNNVYTLKDVNAAGTYFTAIWDGGGTDSIAYDGTRDTVIDLRAATLAYEVGGGGRVSYADGIFGGFTIANGVVIENARSGSGNDTLIGNGANNVLNGGAGDDVIDGGAGFDIAMFSTGQGVQVVHGPGGVITVTGPDGTDTLTNIEEVRFLKAAFELPSRWTTADSGDAGWHVGDFDGDGKDDVFRYVDGQSGADMFLSDGTSFDAAGSWTGAGNGDAGWHVGDFDGDGKSDVFRYVEGVSGAQMFLSDGTGFDAAGSWTGAGNGDAGWHVGDFDGDGKDDVFRYVQGVSGAQVFLSDGGSFDAAGSWTGAGSGDEGWYVGDFNGDGRDDIFRYVTGVSGAQMFLSTGSGFALSGSWTSAGTGDDGWYVADYNGDGRDDVLRYRQGSSGAEVFLSNGVAFDYAGSWSPAGNGDEGWSVGDFTGDGTADLLRVTGSGTDVLI